MLHCFTDYYLFYNGIDIKLTQTSIGTGDQKRIHILFTLEGLREETQVLHLSSTRVIFIFFFGVFNVLPFSYVFNVFPSPFLVPPLSRTAWWSTRL